jgi:voltage-gated sodium channel
MLSLFIGAVTNSMGENMEVLKEEQKARQMAINKQRNMVKMAANEAMKKVIKDKMEAKKRLTEMQKEKEEEEAEVLRRSMVEVEGEEEEPREQPNSAAPVNAFRRQSAAVIPIQSIKIEALVQDVDDHHIEDTHMTKVLKIALGDVKAKDEYFEEKVERRKTPYQKLRMYYEMWGDICIYVVTHPIFSNFMTLVICLAGLNVGAQTDLRLQRIPAVVTAMGVLDQAILAFFTLEVILKLFGEKFMPLRFFESNWNKFDFIIVVGSFVPGVGTGITVLRLLRLLRVLKLVKRLPQLAVIINALLNGIASIGYIGVILFLVFYVFAILGIVLFRDNDPWHYGTLHITLINLFRIATLDNTNNIMYISIFGCHVGGLVDIYAQFPEFCTNPSASPFFGLIFHLIFVTLAAQVLLTLFIGVISTSMEEAKEAKDLEMQREQELADYAAETGLTNAQIEAFKEVFQMLDLDGEGVISDEELKIGLGSIDMHLSDQEITDITNLVDKNDEGLDLAKFIRFMFKTPKYAPGAAAASIAFKIKQKELKSTKKPWSHKVWRWIVQKLPFLETRDAELEHEAALILQDAWRRKLAKRAAALEIERKLQEEAASKPSRASFLNGNQDEAS